MRKRKIPVLIFLLLFFSNCTYSQLDSIFDQGVYRTYIVHLPPGYSPANTYPLVLNLHGLNSSASGQENYSGFDQIADTAGFIVVYPNAINGSWSVNGTSDVNFLLHLVDTLKNDFSINSYLFCTGMSMGGFMTYKVACASPAQITAIAVVSGNMSNALQNNCAIANGIPLMHFHGTADQFVNYNGTFGISTVENTIQWWVNADNCLPTPVITPVADTSLSDSSHADKFYYQNGVNNSEVTFYKIYNGGHTWPGANPIPPFGNTNQDINASQLIWTFFRKYCQPIPIISWTGNSNGAWENPLNWNTGQLPPVNCKVIISSAVPNYPSISSNVEIRSIELQPGSSLTVKAGGSLKLNGH